MLYPYYGLLISTSAATMYMMSRMVLVRRLRLVYILLFPALTDMRHRDTRPGSATTKGSAPDGFDVEMVKTRVEIACCILERTRRQSRPGIPRLYISSGHRTSSAIQHSFMCNFDLAAAYNNLIVVATPAHSPRFF